MPTIHPILGLALVSVLASAGCRSSDALSGTWSNDTCFGSSSTPEDIESCGVALTFTDDLEVSLEAEWISLPATATYPGCITTKTVTGQSWSTKSEADHEVLTIQGNGSATAERSGCVNSEDDMDPTAASDIAIPSGDIDYQIIDGVLTILSSDLQGAYES